MTMKKRLSMTLVTLVALIVFSMLLYNLEYIDLRNKLPLLVFNRGNSSEADPLVKIVYLDGRRIGTFRLDAPLPENVRLTVVAGRGTPPAGAWSVLSASSRALGNASTTSSPAAPRSFSVTSTTTPTTTLTTTPTTTLTTTPTTTLTTTPTTTLTTTPTTTPAVTKTADPNAPHYICPNFHGRLGNHLFIFASSFGVAAQRNMSVVVPSDSMLRNIFTVTASNLVNVTKDDTHCRGKTVNVGSGACCKYNPDVLKKITGTQNVRLGGHLQSYRYFEDVEEALREALTLTPEYKTKSSQALLKALKTRYSSSQEWEGRTLVGVHVRRGDFLSPDAVKFGHVAAPAEFFTRAMTYFDTHYHNVTYVICSDTLEWARANVRHKHSVLVESGSALVDFSVLSRLNHTVVSTGSFGWWAAWLANGTTVYYKDFIKKGSPLSKQFNSDGADYIPPHWIPL